jgi:hypothetical protein
MPWIVFASLCLHLQSLTFNNNFYLSCISFFKLLLFSTCRQAIHICLFAHELIVFLAPWMLCGVPTDNTVI